MPFANKIQNFLDEGNTSAAMGVALLNHQNKRTYSSFYLLGQVAHKRRDFDLALSYYCQSNAIKPRNKTIYAIAYCEYFKENYKKAYFLLLPIKKNYSKANSLLAYCLYRLEKYESALEYLFISLNADSTNKNDLHMYDCINQKLMQ